MSTPAEKHFDNLVCTEVHIGHASPSNPNSGIAADKVLISNYYSALKPTVVLHPKTRKLAELSAAACEAGCTNNKIEYSQTYRDTLNDKAKNIDIDYDLAKITETCYADCSSFMIVCAIAGGARITYRSDANCSNMRSIFEASGDYEIREASKYLLSSEYLERGDILVRENFLNGSRHTVMVLDNGSKIPTINAQWLDNFFAIKISVNITNIKTTEATINAKITKIENNKEKALSDYSKLNAYNWTYTLTSLTSLGKKSEPRKLQVGSSSTKLSLTHLKSDNSYILKVTAKEKDGEAEFNSPNIIFTTLREKKPDSKAHIEFIATGSTNKICKPFIKVKDAFKPAILYNRREE